MRYLMTVSYDGSKYHGYQKQPDMNSVQETLENILTSINSNNFVSISASGRTDSGVHALNQKIHFNLDKELNVEKLKYSINRMLPPSIYVKDLIIVSDTFHARFDVKRKEYTYKINLGEYNPIECDYVYQYNSTLDIDKMKEASKYFMGEHNFKSYTKGCEDKESYIRTIYDIKISLEGNILSIVFSGSGFLRYMVRNMVGSLIEVGANKIEPKIIKEIIEAEDRKESGICAPASGLYLSNVIYED